MGDLSLQVGRAPATEMGERGEMDEEQFSGALANALDKAFLQTEEMEFSELLAVYKGIEKEALERVAGNAFLTLETKRRVAERIFQKAIGRRCSLELCRDLLVDLSNLGFALPHAKATAYIIYSMRCKDTDRAEEGTALLEQLEEELRELYQREGSPGIEELLTSVRRRLKKMKGAPSA